MGKKGERNAGNEGKYGARLTTKQRDKHRDQNTHKARGG